MREKLIGAIDTLTQTDTSAISVKSGCEMLLRFITLTALDAGVRYLLSFFIVYTVNIQNNFKRLMQEWKSVNHCY